MTEATCADISPVASAEHVAGRCFVKVRATSIFICAVPADIRNAVATSSRSMSSTPNRLFSRFEASAPATATIAFCKSALTQLVCFSNAAR